MNIKMNNNTFISNSRLSRLFVFGLTVLSVVLSSAFLSGCSKQDKLVLSGPTMGTQYKVTLTCLADQKVDELTEEQWSDIVLAEITKVNNAMSTYIPDSELSLFNKSISTDFQDISASLLDVYSGAQRVSLETKGAFDVTVMPAVNLWGFGPVKKGLEITQPTIEELDTLKAVVNYKNLSLDKSFTKWKKSHPQTQVDFSAIAKGYAVDKVADKLFEAGCENFLVDIGGELTAHGVNAEKKPWRLAIEKPDSHGGFQGLIDVTNISIASSGDYKNFYFQNGKRFSHTIDPRTLKPITHNLSAVTVLDRRAQRADALATAFMVMGNDAVEFAEENNIPAYFIFRLPESMSEKGKLVFQVLYTEGFEKFIVK